MHTPGTLTLGPGVTVQGSRGAIGGSVYYAEAMNLVNQGTIRSDLPGLTLTIQASSTDNAAGGVLSAEEDLVVTQALTSSGSVVVHPGATLSAQGGYTQLAGSTDLAGGVFGSPSAVDLQGGTLLGTGTVAGSLQSAGTVAPGASVGTLTVTGNYDQLPGGELQIEVSGTAPGEADVLAVGGATTLAGLLAVTAAGGYAAAPGDTFDAMSWGSQTGAFDSITATGLGAGLGLQESYLAALLQLQVVSLP